MNTKMQLNHPISICPINQNKGVILIRSRNSLKKTKGDNMVKRNSQCNDIEGNIIACYTSPNTVV